MLTAVVRASSHALLDREPELVFPAVALVDVKRLVLVERHHHKTGIDRAAKELNSVIRVIEHLDELDRCSASHRT